VDLSIGAPAAEAEIVRAFEAATLHRLDGEVAALEEALLAVTHLHLAGWQVLALVRRHDVPVGWVGWVPVDGGRWYSLLQLRAGEDSTALVDPSLCWLAHSGARLREQHGAGALESLFTIWEDDLATGCAQALRRHQWDVRAAGPSWSTRWEPMVRSTVRALTWTDDAGLPHRCLRGRTGA
jgi:hypothetical protein